MYIYAPENWEESASQNPLAILSSSWLPAHSTVSLHVAFFHLILFDMHLLSKPRLASPSTPFLLCSLFLLHACIKSAISSTTRQATAELPLLDDAATVQPGQAIFTLNLLVQSQIFGLSPLIVNGIISLTSQHVAIDPLSWHVRDAAVEDPSLAVYRLLFEVVVPEEQAGDIESAAKTFLDSGGLSDAFASQGVTGINFQVLDPGSGHTHGHAPQGPASGQEAQQYNQTVDLSLLVETLTTVEAGMEFSRHLDLYVRSPTIYFPTELRDAIRWFLGVETGAEDSSNTWFLSDFYVVNATFGQYIATFVHVGEAGSTEAALSQATQYTKRQALTTSLRAADATDVNVTILEPLSAPNNETAAGTREGYSSIDILLRISAPITGLSPAVLETIKSEGARATGTSASQWTLSSATLASANGPFLATLLVPAASERRVAVVRAMTGLVRSRAVDHAVWARGYTDVRVVARKRVTAFGAGSGGARGGGAAIASTAATVGASLAGMALVVAVAALVLGLVPRGQKTAAGRAWFGRR